MKQWGSPCRPRAKIDSYPKHVQKSGPLVLSRLWSPKIASIKQPKRHVFCFLRGPIFQLQTPESPHRIWESCGATGVISFVESSLDDEMMTRWPGLRKMLGENFDTIFFYWIVVLVFFPHLFQIFCGTTVVLLSCYMMFHSCMTWRIANVVSIPSEWCQLKWTLAIPGVASIDSSRKGSSTNTVQILVAKIYVILGVGSGMLLFHSISGKISHLTKCWADTTNQFH